MLRFMHRRDVLHSNWISFQPHPRAVSLEPPLHPGTRARGRRGFSRTVGDDDGDGDPIERVYSDWTVEEVSIDARRLIILRPRYDNGGWSGVLT